MVMNICSDMEIAALTHRGLVREVNEDRHYVKCLDEQTLLMAVVDGMGGGPAGSAAAEAMREALTEYPVAAPHPEQALSNLVITASEAILAIAHDNPALEGMGTTVTATVLSNGTAHWAHVGDTRFYVFRQGRLIQVTTDQTMAQLLVEEGRLTPDEARTHPYGHLLDQCVGCPDCDPVTGSLPIEPGDLLLHTTDGLHDALSEREIIDILTSSHASIDKKAAALISAGLDSGGHDNMTVILTSI
jgi:serine/threonine protein phosphatase PrpC